MTPEQAARIALATQASADAVDRMVRREGRASWTESDYRLAESLKREILITLETAK